MASFRLKLEANLDRRGVEVIHDPDEVANALLVIGGTRRLLPLLKARQRGERIVQRLDGINWVQRVRWSGLQYTLRAEYGNALLAFIRKRLADGVVYQSQFIRRWWEDWYGLMPSSGKVILNGVDLDTFNPIREDSKISKRDILHHKPYRLLVVEGSLAGGLDTGLRVAVRLADILSDTLPVELLVAGKVDTQVANRLVKESRAPLRTLGTLARPEIPELMRSAHLLFSAEINPPCPNAVIEAMACGLPVIGFDTGSLRELIGDEAGRLVPYGGDAWKLELPDVPALAEAAKEVLLEQRRYRSAARARAEAEFGIDKMVDAYLDVLLGE